MKQFAAFSLVNKAIGPDEIISMVLKKCFLELSAKMQKTGAISAKRNGLDVIITYTLQRTDYT